ncbi:hypothetical protein ZIOFF_050892 [Zingiber officinale]|uniref:Uncharacterized protein n=1 Tax=Zingiber officinale TaxID=94328 RepID=A0A8J5KRM2_ZINOF|nr:hypothetical protein ZIOFF_050892 [Zingiber officinale]
MLTLSLNPIAIMTSNLLNFAVEPLNLPVRPLNPAGHGRNRFASRSDGWKPTEGSIGRLPPLPARAGSRCHVHCGIGVNSAGLKGERRLKVIRKKQGHLSHLGGAKRQRREHTRRDRGPELETAPRTTPCTRSDSGPVTERDGAVVMKVQPVDARGGAAGIDQSKPAAKSRLKRLFERQLLRISAPEKPGDGRERERSDDGGEVDPSSVCLDKMVLSFMEEGGGERAPRGRCNCFNSIYDDSSDDDFSGGDHPPPADAAEFIKVWFFFPLDKYDKSRSNISIFLLRVSNFDSSTNIWTFPQGLILCASNAERNLLADSSKIMDKTKNSKGKGECRRILVEELQSLGYDAAICKSKWDKSSSLPAGTISNKYYFNFFSRAWPQLTSRLTAGEYDYIDVVVDGGERLLVDVDFRSEFEIARSTKSYRAMLQHLPPLFVGRPDRMLPIVAVVSEAARQSLKKKGLHVPPWRKPDYMRAKWLSPYTRTAAHGSGAGEDITVLTTSSLRPTTEPKAAGNASEPMAEPWQPPPARPRAGVKVVAGLTAVL